MKIRIPAHTVEVDEKAWAFTYGCSLSEVRDDVKEYFGNAGQAQHIVKSLGLEKKESECDS